VSERIYIRIDWLIAYESIKNFFNREYPQYPSIENISASNACKHVEFLACFSLSSRFGTMHQ